MDTPSVIQRVEQEPGSGGIAQGELARASGVSTTTISLFLAGKRMLRPAMEVRIVQGLERVFRQRGCRLDTAFFDSGWRWVSVVIEGRST